MAHRFFIPSGLFASDEITLPEDIARQVHTVLRLRPGEHILVLDGLGAEAEVELTTVSRMRVTGRVLERRPGIPEPRTHVTLCQGLLKADLFEWVLQKGTELGIAAFLPIQSRRSLPGLEAISAAKMTRWQAILREAAEQCGRSHIPTLSQPQPFERVLQTLPTEALALVFWEGARAHERPTGARMAAAREPQARVREPSSRKGCSPKGEPGEAKRPPPEAREPSLRCALRDTLRDSHRTRLIYLFIGPRDGLTEEEARFAAEHGARVVSLGARILRAETAALTAAALTLYEYQELE